MFVEYGRDYIPLRSMVTAFFKDSAGFEPRNARQSLQLGSTS